MDPRKAAIIEKIRKLLARDEGRGATEAEAATAMAMARRLMDEHDLDEADLGGDSADGWATGTAHESDAPRASEDHKFIGPILATFFGVMPYTEQGGDLGYGARLRIFGTPARVEVAKWVYAFLAATFDHLWVEYRARTKCRKDRRGAFLLGLSRGLAMRLYAERRAEEAARPEGPAKGEPGKGLATLNDRLRAAFEAAHPGMKSGRRSTFRDGDTIRAGVKKGHEISIARPVGGSGPLPLADKRK